MAKNQNGLGHSSGAYYSVLIIGAGISGISAGCQLKQKLGLDNFIILDRQDGIGGTWWSHRYPGVACDLPAQLYSYSFARSAGWSTLNPSGEEIQKYMIDVCQKYEIVDKFHLNTTVLGLEWDEVREEWVGQTTISNKTRSDGASTEQRTIRAKVVISAVGKFGEPDLSILQEVPGIDLFTGQQMHTAQWDSSVDLTDKNITVVGAGCSAAQIVPQLVTSPLINPKLVTQIIRSPPWVAPNHLSGCWLRLWEKFVPWLMSNIPGMTLLIRLVIFTLAEVTFFTYYRSYPRDISLRGSLARRLASYLEQEAPKEYLEILTPDYVVGCKRIVRDTGWLACLHDPKFQLYRRPIKRFEMDNIVLEDKGQDIKIPTDVIILATGYESHGLLQSLRITGRDRTDLHQCWVARGGPQAYLGLAVDRFPNLFILYGPNTSSGHSGVISGIENATSYIMKAIKPIIEGSVSVLEVQEDACSEWTQSVQEASSKSIWANGGCNNWYIDARRWNSMIYPFSQIYNAYCCSRVTWAHWIVTPTGAGSGRNAEQERAKMRIFIVSTLLILVALVLTISPGYLKDSVVGRDL